MSWPYVVAAVVCGFAVGAMFGVIVMGRLVSASRALEELDHIFLSRRV